MTGREFIQRSLRFHWRSHLGVLLGATLATAILAGALAVGDSVRYSLREMALARLGNTYLTLNSQSRFFRADLADKLTNDLKAPIAPVILLRGTAASQPTDGSEGLRTGQVQIVGTDARFWNFAPSLRESGNTTPPAALLARPDSSGELSGTNAETVVLNDRLARQLNVKTGGEVILRVDKPSLLSRDAPLATIEDASVPVRLTVSTIVSDRDFGRFSLAANQIPPLTAFVPIKTLQKTIGLEARANALLVGSRPEGSVASSEATSALWKYWELTDSGLELRHLTPLPPSLLRLVPRQGRGSSDSEQTQGSPFPVSAANEVRKGAGGLGQLELRTDRVFLDPSIAEAALTSPGAQGVLTYFVNELRVGSRATPYSTVAAMQGSVVPPDMKNNEIIVNQWFAEDVGAKVGDTVTLKYWLVGPLRKLEEHTADFRIRAIVPMAGKALDPALMPDIPGLSDKKDCRDWEPGVPVDLDKIRDKDQTYWDRYRGTPKGFITLAAGQKIWNNRFGNLTAVRFDNDGPDAEAKVKACIQQALNPASLGLFFTDVREQALAASSQSLDFGLLFIGFSFFLIVAALLLTALLFAFGAEQRAEEVGTLLALGFTPGRVQRFLLAEGALIAFFAAVAGAAVALFYTRAVIAGLSGVWSGAVANSALQFHAEPSTLAIGALSGFLMALFSIWLVTRRQAKTPARELLNAGSESGSRLLENGGKAGQKGRLPGLPMAIVGIGGALILVSGAILSKQDKSAGYFFGAGALLLIGTIAACRLLMARLERASTQENLTTGSLGIRNMARRLGRSLSVIALLACGSFLVVAVGANRHDPAEGAEQRSSGTGGFALYAEATLPVYQDLNSEEGHEAFGLSAEDFPVAPSSAVPAVVQMRLREGDDASCLNLNRAQTPRLLGVQPFLLSVKKAFTFTQSASQDAATFNPDALWNLLNRGYPDGAIPVVGDMNTVVWSLGKKLGDDLQYKDERGAVRKLRIVGVLANSILQGSLIMSETNFISMFPSHSGYQVFLVDAPKEKAAALAQTLNRALEDVGMTATPAPERLAMFNAVENTYLSIFAVLGGLGLLLGSLGLGVVVLRNVLERRSELALLRAVGFRQSGLQKLVFAEHVLLLLLGLLAGVVSALVATLPALRSPGANVPIVSLAFTLLAVLVSGFVWTYGATLLALRGPLLNALRNE